MNHPNAEKHLKLSIVKSIFRIIGGTFLMCNMTIVCGLFLVLAELIGIAEELV